MGGTGKVDGIIRSYRYQYLHFNHISIALLCCLIAETKRTSNMLKYVLI